MQRARKQLLTTCFRFHLVQIPRSIQLANYDDHPSDDALPILPRLLLLLLRRRRRRIGMGRLSLRFARKVFRSVSTVRLLLRRRHLLRLMLMRSYGGLVVMGMLWILMRMRMRVRVLCRRRCHPHAVSLPSYYPSRERTSLLRSRERIPRNRDGTTAFLVPTIAPSDPLVASSGEGGDEIEFPLLRRVAR